MALQVGRSKNKYLGQDWHLLKRKYWGGPTSRGVVSLMVQFFCEKEPVERTPIKFHGFEWENYDPVMHKGQLCKLCVDVAKSYNKKGGEQAKPSHS